MSARSWPPRRGRVLAHRGRQVGAAIAIDVEGDRHVLRHAPDELEHVADDLRHAGLRLHGAEIARLEVGAQRLVAMLEHRLEKLLLVAEVIVERVVVELGALGDAVDARAAVAMLGELVHGRGEDRGARAGGFVVLALPRLAVGAVAVPAVQHGQARPR